MKRINHLAVLPKGHHAWNQGENSEPELYKKVFNHSKKLIKWQIKHDIPIVTVNLLSDRLTEQKSFLDLIDPLVDYFTSLLGMKEVFKEKIKISIFGKWYDLPPKAVDSIKRVMDETKDYDSYFFNICINYDGQREIVDATKIVGLKVISGRASVNNIDKDMIKDTIYSSSFLPPDLIIKTGRTKKLYGFLLWDAIRAHIYFCEKYWLDFKEKDLKKAMNDWKELS